MRESTPNGQVIAFEAFKHYSDIIKNVIELNDVEPSCEIRNVLVGSDVKIYAEGEHNKSIHPQELPECDVLEMDCEGAELGIIRNLNIRPQVIIMEVHPQRYEHAPEAINELADIGYNIVSYRSNEGEKLTEDQFNKVLEKCSRGEAPASIIVGINSPPH